MMVQQHWSGPLQPAHLSQITIMGLELRVQLDVAGRSENFLVDTGATYSVLTSYSGAFSSQTCTIFGTTGNTITKRFTWALCCWDGQIFSHQFLVVPDCPPPLLGRNLSLPSKPCSYCNLDRRCFKILFWGQSNYFYQPPNETTTKWKNPFMAWSKNPQISSTADGNPGLTISPCESLNPATLLPTTEGSLPFQPCLETLDHWTKPQEGLSEDSLTNPEEIWYTEGSTWSWMEKEKPDMQ